MDKGGDVDVSPDLYKGYVSLHTKEDRYWIRACKAKPNPSKTLLGFVEIIGTTPSPQVSWKESFMCWEDKNYDYCDGCFFEEVSLEALWSHSGRFEMSKGLVVVSIIDCIKLYDASGQVIQEKKMSDGKLDTLKSFMKNVKK